MKVKAGLMVVTTLGMMFGAGIWAQQKAVPKTDAKPAENNDKSKVKKKIFSPAVYLGKVEFAGGPVATPVFDSLLKQGISCHDSAGTRYKILNFTFTYAERKLYEDSAADLHMMTDYTAEVCSGDTISHDIAAEIYERIKPGDTVTFTEVLVARANATRSTDTFLGKSLKCIITK